MDKEDVVYLYYRIFFCHKKEILPFGTTRMDLEGFMLRKVSLTEKNKYSIVLLIYGVLRSLTESRMFVPRGWGWGKWGHVGQRAQLPDSPSSLLSNLYVPGTKLGNTYPLSQLIFKIN